MKEKNRKDWIKNVLIIFLVILLLLTFFSNTIMNYSLAEASVDYISSGNIATAIRGSGTIQAVDPYSVVLSQGRTIESVNVRKGDVVSKGDVLFVLEEGISTEADDAQDAYESLVEEYQKYIIENRVSNELVTAAESGDSEFLNNNMSELTGLSDILKAKEDALAAIDAKISISNVTIVDTSTEEAQLEAARTAVTNANNKITEAEGKLAEYESSIIAIQQEFAALSSEEQAAKQSEVVNSLVALADAKKPYTEALNAAKADLETYQTQITNLEKAISDKQAAQSDEAAALTYERAVAANEVATAQKDYDEIYNKIMTQMQLEDMLDKIADAKEVYDNAMLKAVGNEVLAPVSGTITQVNVVAGEKVAADTTLAVIQLSGKDYIMEMSVTKEQAAKIRIGDVADVASSWYYWDMVLTVSAIKNDTSNPQNKIIVFTVTGSDITPGQNVTVSVGEKSASYNMVVPNTAVREDSNGTYILIVTSKNTPLGNRYTATRVDVKKLASDDTNTAISGGLEGWESVITTSTKPISAGDQIRLAD